MNEFTPGHKNNEKCLQTDTVSAAQHAYEIVAREKGVDINEVHRMGVCHRMSALMVERLVEVNSDARQETRVGWTVLDHSYVELSSSDGEDDIIADATWQQFTSVDIIKQTNAPKVLIGQREDFIAVLRENGVNERTIDEIWQKRS